MPEFVTAPNADPLAVAIVRAGWGCGCAYDPGGAHGWTVVTSQGHLGHVRTTSPHGLLYAAIRAAHAEGIMPAWLRPFVARLEA